MVEQNQGLQKDSRRQARLERRLKFSALLNTPYEAEKLNELLSSHERRLSQSGLPLEDAQRVCRGIKDSYWEKKDPERIKQLETLTGIDREGDFSRGNGLSAHSQPEEEISVAPGIKHVL